MLPPLLAAYERTGDAPGARNFLSEMSEHDRGIAPVLALTRLVEVEDGVAEARAYLSRQLQDRPSVRGEAALIDLTLAAAADPAAPLHDPKHLTDQLLARHPNICTTPTCTPSPNPPLVYLLLTEQQKRSNNYK